MQLLELCTASPEHGVIEYNGTIQMSNRGSLLS